MDCLTREEVRQALSLPVLALQLDDKLCPYFDETDAECFSFHVPERGSSLPYLSRVLALLEVEEESQFAGASLWFDLWDIGSPQMDKIGWGIVERMRLGYGETRPIEIAPAHRFRSDESTQLQGFVLQPLIFQWDANLVYAKRDRFVHVSHDGFIVIAAKTKAVYGECWSQLGHFGPESASPQVRTRFCRPRGWRRASEVCE